MMTNHEKRELQKNIQDCIAVFSLIALMMFGMFKYSQRVDRFVKQSSIYKAEMLKINHPKGK